MTFNVLVPTSDYTVDITNAGGLKLTFTNAIHFTNWMSWVQSGKMPKIVFESDTVYICIGNWVANSSDKSLSAIFYLNSSQWGDAIKAKTLQLYLMVG